MEKETIEKMIVSLEEAIQMNGSRYALRRMNFVKNRLKKEIGQED